MKEFFQYFFGAGDQVEFTNFSLAHFLPILVLLGILFLIYRFRDQLRQYKKESQLSAERWQDDCPYDIIKEM